jgi:crotonobetainyl-CoA:carnitine CoA-transferase CaiB-like acyl-CoA transferase
MRDNGPLDGLRVVELTDIRGALCGRILADLGADVLHVAVPPAADAEAHAPSELAAFATQYRHANKRQARLDPASAADRSRFEELLREADVLVDNVALVDRDALGVVPDDVAARHPHLVHVALTDLGLTGPRASWRLEALPALAAAGTLHATGFPSLRPCGVPGHLAHDCASVYGAVGAVVGIMHRRRHGVGQLVEVSAQEAALAGTTPWSIAMPDYTHINPFLPIKGNRNADGAYWVLPAADGWVRAVIGTPRQWNGFVALCGDPDALAGPEWHTTGFRLMNADVVRIVAQECLVDRTRAQLFDEALKHGATIGILQTPQEFVEHPQTQTRGYFATPGWAGVEDLPFARLPITSPATPALLRRPAPTADDDGGFAGPRDDGPALPADARGRTGLPLDGLRVVEFGVAAVVPELCGVLSELGGDVIKIESLAHPDVLRQTGGEHINRGFAFNTECRGRRSVMLDLSTDEGRALALELCVRADIVAENHRGGVLDKLGLGDADVRARNPSVIYVSSQGYGRGGPFGEMPAYGPLNAGFSGVHLLWNHAEAPFPCGTSLNHPDHIAGKLAAVAVLAALDQRDRTGEGQHLDMAQTEAAAYLVGEVYLHTARHGDAVAPRGNHSDDFVPHDMYPCAGEDRWVAIVASDDAAWRRLEATAGWAHDPGLATLDGRRAARARIDERLAAWTATRTGDEIAELLQANGVSAMPVMGPLDQREDPHLAERGFIVELEHPEVGIEHQVGNPIRLSAIPQRTARSAPCLGADTEDVLTSVLGLSSGEVTDLIDRGVCR